VAAGPRQAEARPAPAATAQQQHQLRQQQADQEEELHVEFEEAVQRMKDAEAAAGEAPPADEPAAAQGDAHSRKFADSGHVRERLTTQLAGLRRRAAMKQDLE
jgi:hypothetical protein